MRKIYTYVKNLYIYIIIDKINQIINEKINLIKINLDIKMFIMQNKLNLMLKKIANI